MAQQNYWETADWDGLEKYVDDPTTDRFKENSHRYWEDLRKRIWLLWFPQAGTFNVDGHDSLDATNPHYLAKQYAAYGDPNDPLKERREKIAGSWKVTWYDIDYGWLWWTNKEDLTLGQVAQNFPPPDQIHPSDNVWITETTGNVKWHLEADFNKYHQWDVAAPFAYHYGAAVVVRDNNPPNQIIYQFDNQCDRPAHYWLPFQTDPRFQNPLIWWKDEEVFASNIKEKVGYDRRLITQPNTLGNVFTADRWGIVGYYDADDDHELISPWGFPLYNGLYGLQYAAGRGQLYLNSCGGGSTGQGFAPVDQDRLPRTNAWGEGAANPIFNTAEWTFNKKNNWAYQNAAELVLSAIGFNRAADATYIANFDDYHGTSASDRKEHGSWYSHPSMWSHLWGENESSFELVCSKSGEHDWFFNSHSPYYPSPLFDKMYDNFGLDTPSGWSVSQHKAAADVTPTENKGTWRRTWKHSMGRVNRWMRSFEMGEPTRQRGGYNPTAPYDTTDEAKFYGSYAGTFPLINEFDTHFATIDETPQADSIKVLGDITDDLKIGYMVHYCYNETDPINGDGGELTFTHVRRISYDATEDKTLIGLDLLEGNPFGYTKIGWNPNISERHDPIQIAPHDNQEWERLAKIALEIKDKLCQVKFRHATLGVSSKLENYTPALSDQVPSPATTFEDYGRNRLALGRADYYDPDPNNWGSGGPSILQRFGVRHESSSSPAFWNELGALVGNNFNEAAMHLTGDDELVAALHGSAMIRFKAYHVYDDPAWILADISTTYMPTKASLLGFGSVTWQQTSDGTTQLSDNQADQFEYAQVTLPVAIRGSDNKRWAFITFKGQPLMPHRSFDGGGTTVHSYSKYQHWLSVSLGSGTSIPVEYDRVPVSVWEYNQIGHVDAEPAYKTGDKNPPQPDPPVNHEIAIGKFSYLSVEGEFEGGDFNMIITGKCGLCQDMEGSDPVEYRGVQDNRFYASPFLPSREWFLLHKTMSWQEALIEHWLTLDAGATTNPSGTVTRILFSNADEWFDVGDEITIRGTLINNGDWDVLAVSSTTFDIDRGNYELETVAAGEVRHTGTGYGKTEWLLDAVSTTKWGVQARDNAIPVNNKTGFSAFKEIQEPEKYPWEVYTDWLETQFQPEGTTT